MSSRATAQIRITDHFNAVAPGGGTDPATVIDIPFPVVTTVRGDWRHGSRRHAARSPPRRTRLCRAPVKDGKRAIVEIGQLQIIDGGTDGVAATDPNTLFEVQGIFIP